MRPGASARTWVGEIRHLSLTCLNVERDNLMLYSVKNWLLVAVCSSGIACSYSGRHTCSCTNNGQQVATSTVPSSPYATALPSKTAISVNDKPANLPETANSPAFPTTPPKKLVLPLITIEESPVRTPAPIVTPTPAPVVTPAPVPAPAPGAEDKTGPISDSSGGRVHFDQELQRAASTDYASIVGQLEYLHMSRQWRLRYASYDADDVHGGVVTLRGIDSMEGHFKEGMTVRVQGSLDFNSRKPSPDYFVGQLKIVE
jgi:hypothetical protein